MRKLGQGFFAAPSILSHLKVLSVLTDRSLLNTKHIHILILLNQVVILLVLCYSSQQSYSSITFNKRRHLPCSLPFLFLPSPPKSSSQADQHSTTQIEELPLAFHLFEVPSQFRGSPLGPALQEPSSSKTVF